MIAAALWCVGFFLDSTPSLSASLLLAFLTALYWVRGTSPHDHWREFRKRKRWDE